MKSYTHVPYLSQFHMPMPFCLALQSVKHLQFHSHSHMHFILTQVMSFIVNLSI